jgi:amino acid transporter
MATSLAEFLSAYPTAGGQYHWVAVTSWRKWMPVLSWITGWVNCSGWVALVATGGLLGSELILGVISLMNPVSLQSAQHIDSLLTLGNRHMSPSAGINF